MQDSNNKIDGPYRIDHDRNFHGMITEQATVSPGVEFILHGMITGDLIVEEGAHVTVHGMVNGMVRNRGGQIAVYGWVDEIDEGIAGSVAIMPGGRVRGKNGGPL